jgi:hypothetical protein
MTGSNKSVILTLSLYVSKSCTNSSWLVLCKYSAINAHDASLDAYRKNFTYYTSLVCGFKPEVSENSVTFFRSILCLSLERGLLKNYTFLSMVYNTSNHSVFGHLSIVHSLKIWILGGKYRKLDSFSSAPETWGTPARLAPFCSSHRAWCDRRYHPHSALHRNPVNIQKKQISVRG